MESTDHQYTIIVRAVYRHRSDRKIEGPSLILLYIYVIFLGVATSGLMRSMRDRKAPLARIMRDRESPQPTLNTNL